MFLGPASGLYLAPARQIAMRLPVEHEIGQVDADHVLGGELLFEPGMGVELPLIHELADDLHGVVLQNQEWGHCVRGRPVRDPGVG